MALTAREALGDLESGAASAVLAGQRTLPLVAVLADLFPGKGLRRGSTVVVSRGSFPGATSLALALLSGPCAGGSWCAVVGAAELGLVAAAQHGLDLERLALVPLAGPKWPVVTAALLEGFDVVLVCPPGRVDRSVARQLEARGRERGSVLAVIGEGWPGSADMRLGIVSGCWKGLEDGHGYLWGREVEVEAAGKGAACRPRRARFWLGGPFRMAVDGPPGLVAPSPVVPELVAPSPVVPELVAPSPVVPSPVVPSPVVPSPVVPSPVVPSPVVPRPVVLGGLAIRSIAGAEAPGRSRPQVGAGDLAG